MVSLNRTTFLTTQSLIQNLVVSNASTIDYCFMSLFEKVIFFISLNVDKLTTMWIVSKKRCAFGAEKPPQEWKPGFSAGAYKKSLP